MVSQAEEVPTGFKMTELGPLPEDWETQELNKMASTVKGKKPQNVLDVDGSHTVAYLTADCFRTGIPTKFVKLIDEDSVVEVEDKDIVLIWDGSNAGDVFRGWNGILASTMVKLFCDKSVLDVNYLFFVLKTKFELLNSKTTGSTIPHINKQLFQDLMIPLPPLPEQRDIAYILSIIQRTIEAQDKVISAARELKKSLMRHLFTYGPVPVVDAEKARLKMTEIGLMPEHWRICKMGAVSVIGNGSTPNRSNSQYWSNGSIPWLTSGKVHDVIITWADEFVTEIARSECHLPIVPKHSLLVAITGQGKTLGNAAVVTFDTTINQHLAYIKLDNLQTIPEFILVYLQYRYDDLRSLSQGGGSTKGALTCALLRIYPCLLPPIHEQQQIAYTISTLDRKITIEERYKATLQTLFKTMLHLLMTGQLRVNSLKVDD